MSDRNIKPDTTIAFCALLVALMSLLFTVTQNRASRLHDRLSVVPHLQSSVVANRVSNSIDVSVKNNGLGPARIQAFEIYWNGSPVKDILSVSDFRRKIKDIGVTEFAQSATYWYADGDVFAVDDRKPVLSLSIDVDVLGARYKNAQSPIDELSKTQFSKILSTLENLEIKIRYTGFYNKTKGNLSIRFDDLV